MQEQRWVPVLGLEDGQHETEYGADAATGQDIAIVGGHPTRSLLACAFDLSA